MSCAVAGFLGACVDDGDVTGPRRPALLLLQPQYVHLGAAASLPINQLRLVARDSASGDTLGTWFDDVDPTLAGWSPELQVRVEGEAVSIFVTVEMIHVDPDGNASVEWSGIAGPIRLQPGADPASVPIPVYRGPLSNLSVTDVDILDSDTTVLEGTVLALTAAVQGGGDAPVVYWSSTDTSRAIVSAEGIVTTLRPDTAVRILAIAGPHADTLRMVVLQRAVGVAIAVDTARFASLGEQRSLPGRVVDPRGDSVPGFAVAWTVEDSTVVQHLGDGLFQALAGGATRAVAVSVDSAQFSDTLVLIVQQLPASISVTPPLDTVAVGRVATFSAAATDALGNPVPNATFAWSSSSSAVATVTEAGVATGVAPGSVSITAMSGAAAGNATLVVSGTGSSGVTCNDPIVSMHSGAIQANQTWTKAASPHSFSGTFTVDSGAVLTIEPGAVVCGESFAYLYFVNGGRLDARGTPAEPILFSAVDSAQKWAGMYLIGDPADSSYITHATIEHGSYSNGLIYAASAHPVVVEDVTLQHAEYSAAYLTASGSVLRRAVVDDIRGESYYSAYVYGTGSVVQNLTITNAAGHGLYAGGNDMTLGDILISGVGGDGVYMAGVNAALSNLRIENAAGIGFNSGSAGDHLASASNVRVVGSGSYGFRSGIGDLSRIAPTAADQDSLLGNGRDTLIVVGGTLRYADVTVRQDVPWRIESYVNLDSASTLLVQPGAYVAAGPFALIYGYNGGSIDARGTASQPITFTAADPANSWYGIYLYGSVPDTSYLTNVLVEYTRNTAALQAENQHALRLDSVRVRQSTYYAVVLSSAGSRLSRSTIDTTLTPAYPAVQLANGAVFEQSVVRGAAGDGVLVAGNNTSVIGGRIENSGGVGLSYSGGYSSGQGAPVRIIGSGSYPLRASISALARIYPDAASQDSLLGNAVDTIAIAGGVAYNDTATVRADLPWRLETWTYFDSTSVLNVLPGGAVAGLTSSQLVFRTGSTLQAVGTQQLPITFTSVDPAGYWYGMQFQDSPSDTSRLVNVLVENGGITGNGPIYAANNHVVVVDSSRIRNSQYRAVYLVSPGSMLRWSTVDTTATSGTSYPAVELGTNGRIEQTTIRGAAGIGLRLSGNNVTVLGGRIEGAGGVGMYATSSNSVAAGSQPPRVTGGLSYPVQIGIQPFAELFRSAASQDSLLGNAVDTILITGGIATRDTTTVRSDLPWRLETWTYFDSTSVLNVLPGGAVAGVPSSQLVFRSGSTLQAIGTATDSVRFTSTDPVAYWYGLQFQDSPTDTSRIRYGLIENGGITGNGPLYASQNHVLVVDSSRVRNSQYRAVYFNSPGSMLRWTTIDTTLTASTSYPAVEVNAANVVIERGTIRGAALVGLRVTTSGSLAESSVTPRVTGSGGYPMNVPIQAFARLFDSRADQDSVLGNASDTISIQGGTLVGDTVLVGSSLPWRLETWTYFTSNSRLDAEPGATIAGVPSSQLLFQTGSTLQAIGTVTDSIRFTSTNPASTWYGLEFSGTPTDTSRIRYGLIENGGTTGNGPVFTTNTHVLALDSSRVRNSQYRAVYFNSPGSMLRWTTIDTTLTASASYPAVDVNAANVVIERGTIRGAALVGLRVTSSGSLAESSVTPRVTGSGLYPMNIPIPAFAALFDTRADQDSLLGNVSDTISIQGGTLVGDTVLAGSSLPWRLETWTYFTSNSRLDAEPGATIAGVPSSQLLFQTGSTLQALGTATDSVTFTSTDPGSFWYGLEFSGTPTDTSRIRYGLIENGGSTGNGPVFATNAHVLALDSSRVRNSQYRAVYLNSAGSMLRWTTIDTTLTASTSWPAVEVNAANVTIVRGTIRGAALVGLRVSGAGTLAEASVAPRVTGSGSYPMNIPIPAFAALFDTRADQDSLSGNGADTISIQGGTLVSDTVLVGSSLPWRLETTTNLTSNSRMNVEPGATIAGGPSGQLLFQTGSTLQALGTVAQPITFTSTNPAGTWWGMQFGDAPTDTSRIRLAVVENGGVTGNGPLYAVNTHVVVLDSIHVRNSQYRAVYLTSPGSMLLNSTIDTTLTASSSWPAVQLAAGAIMRRTRVRGAAYDGILASGLATVDSVEVVGSGHDGFVSGVATQTIGNSNIILNGFGTDPGAGVRNTSGSNVLGAANNWWGSALGAGSGTNLQDTATAGGAINTTPALGAAVVIPAWTRP